jgi:hypothetical protein
VSARIAIRLAEGEDTSWYDRESWRFERRLRAEVADASFLRELRIANRIRNRVVTVVQCCVLLTQRLPVL